MSTNEQSANSGIAVQADRHDVDVDSSAVTFATSDPLTFVTTIPTLGIPAFHASLTTRDTNLTLGDVHPVAYLARISSNCCCLDLKAAIRIWEAVRNFDSILLAYVIVIVLVRRPRYTVLYRSLVAVLFKESAHAMYWFFITCSLLQASMGLICSTILIISFSGHLEVCFFTSCTGTN